MQYANYIMFRIHMQVFFFNITALREKKAGKVTLSYALLSDSNLQKLLLTLIILCDTMRL